MTLGPTGNRIITGPQISKAQHHPDAIEAGIVPSAALRTAYGLGKTGGMFIAQHWPPLSLSRGFTNLYQIVGDSILWEHETYFPTHMDFVHAHVVYAISADAEVRVRHSVIIDASEGEVAERNLGTEEADWAGEDLVIGHLPALFEAQSSAQVPGSSRGTTGTIQLRVQTDILDEDSGAPIGFAGYRLVGLTLWGVVP